MDGVTDRTWPELFMVHHRAEHFVPRRRCHQFAVVVILVRPQRSTMVAEEAVL